MDDIDSILMDPENHIMEDPDKIIKNSKSPNLNMEDYNDICNEFERLLHEVKEDDGRCKTEEMQMLKANTDEEEVAYPPAVHPQLYDDNVDNDVAERREESSIREEDDVTSSLAVCPQPYDNNVYNDAAGREEFFIREEEKVASPLSVYPQPYDDDVFNDAAGREESFVREEEVTYPPTVYPQQYDDNVDNDVAERGEESSIREDYQRTDDSSFKIQEEDPQVSELKQFLIVLEEFLTGGETKMFRSSVIEYTKILWAKISSSMKKSGVEATSAIEWEEKWNVLVKNFTKSVTNNKSTGRGRMSFEYMAETDKILKKIWNFNSVIHLSSTIRHFTFQPYDTHFSQNPSPNLPSTSHCAPLPSTSRKRQNSEEFNGKRMVDNKRICYNEKLNFKKNI